MTFETDDYGELMALHRALMEAKFASDPDNRYIAASPIVNAVMARIIDALQTHHRARGHDDDWAHWRRSPSAERLARIRDAAAREPGWPTLDEADKQALLRAIAAPFELTDATLEATRQAVDRAVCWPHR